MSPFWKKKSNLFINFLINLINLINFWAVLYVSNFYIKVYFVHFTMILNV